MNRHQILALAAALLAGCGPAVAAEKQQLRILMIGNSYSAMTWGELKGFLDADPKLEAQLVTHTPGGRTLAEHADSEKVGQLLADEKGWDVVVLQDQSQLPAFAMAGPEDGPMRCKLEAGAPVLIRRIHERYPQARVILFETWARHRDPDKADTLKQLGGGPERMQELLSAGYQRMVRNPGGWDFSGFVTIAPVGRAFAAWYGGHGYEDKTRKLHRDDNSHPGKPGAYLTGAVLYQAITGRPASGVGYDGGLAHALARELMETAHRANQP